MLLALFISVNKNSPVKVQEKKVKVEKKVEILRFRQ